VATSHDLPLLDVVHAIDPEMMEIDVVAISDLQANPTETNIAMAELPMGVDSGTSASPLLTKKEVAQIRRHISTATRPSWQAHLPKNFGDVSHGKLKADQWRTCIEFDLPISLAQIWSQQDSANDGSNGLRLEFLDNTMHLAAAVFWGASRRTSSIHAEKYMEHMKSYIKGILRLFPHHNLRPHHHNALHLGEFLLRFGPVHGWWTFPFEQLVGKLQRVNSNSKPGEIYSVMLQSWSLTGHKASWS
jgi:hypothetical protein